MADLFIPREQAEQDLLAAAAFLAERIKSSDGHAEAMGTIIPYYLEKGEVDLSAELANAISDPHSRDKLLSLVAEKCAQINDDEYAIQLADAIEDHGLRAEVFERIGSVKASQGNSAAALEIADLMHHPDFVFAAIAVHQAVNGNEDGADKTMELIEFSPALCSALQTIAAAEIEKGENHKAAATLERAALAAEETEHSEEMIRLLCEIGNQFIDAKRNDRAIETFDKARTYAEEITSGQRDYLLVTCAVGFLHAGSMDLADDTLDLVLDKTQLASALMVFARDSWKREEKEDAVDTLEEAYEIINSQREAEIRDSRSRNTTLAGIAAQFAAFGKTERAVEIAEANPNPQETAAALTQIVQILTLQKNDESAREVMNAIIEDSDRVSALIVMSDAKKRLGDTKAAISILDEAVGMVDSVPQLVARSRIYNDIAERYAGYEVVDKVRSIALENLETIETIRDESSRAAALANLHEVYEKAGLTLEADEKSALERIVRKL
jgi:tetratricopeptide (TPR) repeat protein